MTKKLRPTGRKPYTKRVLGKFTKAKRSNAVVYANRRQYSAVPRSFYGGFPNQFRIRLSANLVGSIVTLGSTAPNTKFRYDLSAPIIPNGTPSSNVAGGFLPLLYIYQRCYVKKVNLKLRFENLNNAPSSSILLDTECHIASAILTQKQATDLIGAGGVTLDEIRLVPTAKFSTVAPFPSSNNIADHSHSVDVLSFIGQPALDHTQASFATESGSNFILNTPNGASAANLPSLFFILERNTTTSSTLFYRVTLTMEFDCEFTNVRPLEQLAGQLLPWSVL